MKTLFESFNKELNIDHLLDESEFMLDADNSYDVFVFRKLLEGAMKMGFWNGTVGSG